MNEHENRQSTSARADFDFIVDQIDSGLRVLDIGCSKGDLLHRLRREKQVAGRGIELDQTKVNHCVASGLSVIQGDADSDLGSFPDGVYDFVILSQTLQATRAPKEVLASLLRIGKQVIVSIPNFAYWRFRLQLTFRGRMPVGGQLPYHWYETPNIHLCTIKDFLALAEELDAKILSSLALGADGEKLKFPASNRLINLMASQAIFVLEPSCSTNSQKI